MQRRMLDEAAMLDALYQEQSVLRDAAEAVIQVRQFDHKHAPHLSKDLAS